MTLLLKAHWVSHRGSQFVFRVSVCRGNCIISLNEWFPCCLLFSLLFFFYKLDCISPFNSTSYKVLTVQVLMRKVMSFYMDWIWNSWSTLYCLMEEGLITERLRKWEDWVVVLLIIFPFVFTLKEEIKENLKNMCTVMAFDSDAILYGLTWHFCLCRTIYFFKNSKCTKFDYDVTISFKGCFIDLIHVCESVDEPQPVAKARALKPSCLYTPVIPVMIFSTAALSLQNSLCHCFLTTWSCQWTPQK